MNDCDAAYFKDQPQPAQCGFCRGPTNPLHRCEITQGDGRKFETCDVCYDCRATRLFNPTSTDLLKAILFIGCVIISILRQIESRLDRTKETA